MCFENNFVVAGRALRRRVAAPRRAALLDQKNDKFSIVFRLSSFVFFFYCKIFTPAVPSPGVRVRLCCWMARRSASTSTYEYPDVPVGIRTLPTLPT